MGKCGFLWDMMGFVSATTRNSPSDTVASVVVSLYSYSVGKGHVSVLGRVGGHLDGLQGHVIGLLCETGLVLPLQLLHVYSLSSSISFLICVISLRKSITCWSRIVVSYTIPVSR